MIKIIEPGTRTVAECSRCGCKFSYEKEDIRGLKIVDGFVPGMTKLPILLESYVKCPQCGKTLSIGNIPYEEARKA